MSDADLLISTRKRVVWTKDEKRLIDRANKLFRQRGDRMQVKCGSEVCPEPHLTMHKDRSDPGGFVLRCGCTDRVFSRSF